MGFVVFSWNGSSHSLTGVRPPTNHLIKYLKESKALKWAIRQGTNRKSLTKGLTTKVGLGSVHLKRFDPEFVSFDQFGLNGFAFWAWGGIFQRVILMLTFETPCYWLNSVNFETHIIE